MGGVGGGRGGGGGGWGRLGGVEGGWGALGGGLGSKQQVGGKKILRTCAPPSLGGSLLFKTNPPEPADPQPPEHNPRTHPNQTQPPHNPSPQRCPQTANPSRRKLVAMRREGREGKGGKGKGKGGGPECRLARCGCTCARNGQGGGESGMLISVSGVFWGGWPLRGGLGFGEGRGSEGFGGEGVFGFLVWWEVGWGLN